MKHSDEAADKKLFSSMMKKAMGRMKEAMSRKPKKTVKKTVTKRKK